MQKQNSVIKNYILSSEKYVLKDEISKYRDNSMNICVKVEKQEKLRFLVRDNQTINFIV